MKTSDITSAGSNILLIGDTGTHKTWFLGTVPRIYVFDFDRGMAVLRHKQPPVEYDTFKEVPKGTEVGAVQSKAGLFKFGDAWPAFIKKLNEIGGLIDRGVFPYKAIGLDSLTFLSQIAMNHVLLTTDQKTPHQGSYGAQQEYIKLVLNTLTTWPVQLICTAHIQRDANDLTGTVEKLPLLTGKLAGFISAYFDEVYYCESSVDAKGVQEFKVITQSDSQIRQAKSRWGVPNKSPLDYEKLLPFYTAKAPEPTAPATPAKV